MKRIKLTDAQMNSIAGRAEVLQEFPFFASMRVEKKACCGRVVGHSLDYAGVRQAIFNLGPDARAKFKKLIHADEVAFFVPGEHGKLQHVTI